MPREIDRRRCEDVLCASRLEKAAKQALSLEHKTRDSSLVGFDLPVCGFAETRSTSIRPRVECSLEEGSVQGLLSAGLFQRGRPRRRRTSRRPAEVCGGSSESVRRFRITLDRCPCSDCDVHGRSVELAALLVEPAEVAGPCANVAHEAIEHRVGVRAINERISRQARKAVSRQTQQVVPVVVRLASGSEGTHDVVGGAEGGVRRSRRGARPPGLVEGGVSLGAGPHALLGTQSVHHTRRLRSFIEALPRRPI